MTTIWSAWAWVAVTKPFRAMNTLPRLLLVAALAHCGGSAAFAQATNSAASGASTSTATKAPGTPGATGASSPTNAGISAASLVTDPTYRLSVGDQIAVTVYDEPEFTSNELIDNDGIAKLTLLGETKLAGRTVRDAEKAIAALYVERKFLKKPDVKLVVTQFVPREILLFGEVKSPGGLAFPRDLTSMDIVEVIMRAGGFSVRAKSNAVTVTRKSADGGKETSETVNVEAMMSARSGDKEQRRLQYPIYPGDRIIVSERLF